jgi:hypothetical protein
VHIPTQSECTNILLRHLQLPFAAAGPITPQPSPPPTPSPSPTPSNPSPSPEPSTPSPSPTINRPSPSPSPAIVTPQPPPAGGCIRTAQAWQQCGGFRDGCAGCGDAPWAGVCCASGLKCTRDNPWYW